MPHDVFISHSTTGNLTANAICNRLESLGIRCWILPRDLNIALPWDQSIANAIACCRIMIVVFSDYAGRSDRIERQLGCAFNNGVIVIPFRIESIDLVSELDSHPDSVHWLDAWTPELGKRLTSLSTLITGLLLRQSNDPATVRTLGVSHPEELRRANNGGVTELHEFKPTESEEESSKDHGAEPSEDSLPAKSSSDIPERADAGERKLEGNAESSRLHRRKSPILAAIGALLLIATPFMLILGVGFWRAEWKSRPAKPPAALTAQAAEPLSGKTLYEDRFVSSDSGWGAPDANWTITEGKLRITPLLNTSAMVFNKSRGFEDAEIAIDVAMSNGNDLGQLGGLIFWAKDYNDCYAMVFSTDGKFAIGRKLLGRWINPIAKKENGAIKTGIGQTNQLRVRTQGSLVTAYINDNQVASLVAEPPQGGAYIGLYGESAEASQNVWDFTNLTVTGVR